MKYIVLFALLLSLSAHADSTQSSGSKSGDNAAGAGLLLFANEFNKTKNGPNYANKKDLEFVKNMKENSNLANDPQNFIKKCYQDYVQGCTFSKESTNKQSEVRKRCLSKEYLKSWDDLVERTDMDVMVLAQDCDFKKVEVKDVDAKNRSAKVYLDKQCILVKWLDEKSQPRIDSTQICTKGM